MEINRTKITIIGLGNVGFHLAKVFAEKGYAIHQVFSSSANKEPDFVRAINAKIITKINQLDYSSDIFIFCLKDEVLPDILSQTSFTNQLLLHTAGSIDMHIFKGKSKNYGVFYPLQTFSKSREIDFQTVPICVEGSNHETEKRIRNFAESISKKVVDINSLQRKYIHLAAVFASNYSNAMYAIAQEILKEHQMDFDIIRPLIKETAEKVMEILPDKAQTGPAIRNDNETLINHLALLNDEEKKTLYRLIAGYIQRKNNH